MPKRSLFQFNPLLITIINFIPMTKKSIFSFTLVLLMIIAYGCSNSSEPIFNGKDLSNWKLVVDDDNVNPEEVFYVEDGIINIKGQPFGYMYTKNEYKNFTLNLEYRWKEAASNSGIFVMVQDKEKPFPKTVECQLHAGDAGDFVMILGAELEEYVVPEGTERPQYPVLAKRAPSSEKPVGEWNKVKITAENGVITVYINDVLQNSATSKVTKGNLALQSEGGGIQFRNITIN